MAGDIPLHEYLVIRDADAPVEAPGDNPSVAHRYGGRVRVVTSPEAIEFGQVFRDVDDVPPELLEGLDDVERLGVEALRRRQSSEYRELKENRPRDREPWDMASCVMGASLDAANPPGTTSTYLEGSVVVGVVFVEGPTVDLKFTSDEREQIVAEAQNSLSFFIWSNRWVPLSFDYSLVDVQLSQPAAPLAPDLEAVWLPPTMQALGYTSPLEYAEALRRTFNTDWTYCAFFTKYPLQHFAYAYPGGPYMVMDPANDGWGPENIDRVFAHETGHVFNGPDEYEESNCSCAGTWGRWQVPDSNCDPCAQGGSVPCIMSHNDWTMCPWTPLQLGWLTYFGVYQSNNGIGGYDLKSSADRAIAFDYDASGKLDHLVFYRPGAGIIYIIRKNPDGTFSAVYQSNNGIGGYDLKSSADRAIAFDYDSSGKLDHLALYRPGKGVFWILRRVGADFYPVYTASPNYTWPPGIGGYDFASSADQAFVYDYNASGKLDNLVPYRPGTGLIWILSPVGRYGY